jgi:pimeloyl-ACP methyl ester carboxylesterase
VEGTVCGYRKLLPAGTDPAECGLVLSKAQCRGDAKLLHGNGTLIQDLTISGLVDAAAQTFRVFCFDRPGFGYSKRNKTGGHTPEAQADVLLKALHMLGVKEPIIMAHSWATLIALAMASDRRNGVKGVVLICGYYFPTWRFDAMIAGFASPTGARPLPPPPSGSRLLPKAIAPELLSSSLPPVIPRWLLAIISRAGKTGCPMR